MKKLLVANRGEIAVRIIRAAKEEGFQTVAVFSKADEESLPVVIADEAVCIGEAPSNKSYLNMAAIISACEITGANYIHPGFGFLSENSHFASICEACNLNFIGPKASTIALLGDKAEAKKTAKKVNCPVIPGSEGVVSSVDAAKKEALSLGFPLFIKAVAGGGGKGIRIASSMQELETLFLQARNEARASFGNPEVYLEKMIHNPRHIEIQVMCDKQGKGVYFTERDCSIQRRRQKLIEETPSTHISADLRKKMGEAALRIVQSAGYISAGTVEFLVDLEENFYFMEVNTRIQVEHTVTEELYGVDLVREQIRVATGKTLSWEQKDLKPSGHVIQMRINAENPYKGFTPCPGKLEHYLPPGGPHVRVDSAAYGGYVIPHYYDSMIAKLIVKGKNREDAITIAKRAVDEFYIGGIETTLPFHRYMLSDENFLQGNYDLRYIDELIEKNQLLNLLHKVEL